MEILVWLPIIGVVIALTRLWATACQESPSSADAVRPAPAHYEMSNYRDDSNSAN